jgi:cell division protein FtsB
MLVDDKADRLVERGDREATLLRPTRHGAHRASRRRRRRALVALTIVLALLGGLAGSGYLAYSSVKLQVNQLQAQLTTHLELGQKELEAAKTSLKQANASHDEKLIDQAKVHFLTAKLQFMTASQIADNNDLLRRLEGFPSVGQLARSRHTSVDSVSEMGVQLALAGQDLAVLDGQLIKPAGSGQQGQGLLTVVTKVQDKIGTIRAELKAALKAADGVDMGVLPGGQQAAFLKARGSISLALASIEQFQSLVPILVEVLGGNGPRNYLIEQVNPAELRPGGGFIGTYSLLRADHGTLTLVKSGGAEELTLPRASFGAPGYVAPPGPLHEFVPNTSWSFLDSNFFPDFPSNAQAAIGFAQPHLSGYHIDAVISIDYYVVAKLLQLTGPMDVPGYALKLTADNFIQFVVQYDIQALTDPVADREHKAILAAVAGPLFQRVVALQPSQWPALLGALNDLAASRHLQISFNNGDVEKTIDQYGWSGALKTGAATDYMMEVESNLGGTKANYYITRSYAVELTRSGGTLHHKVSVDLWNDMPWEDRPGEYYRPYFRLYVSDKESNLKNDLSRPRYANPPPPAGTHMSDGWINRTLHGYHHEWITTFEWDTPWQPNGRGQEQIYWQKQPGTLNDKIDVTWHDGNGHTYNVSGDLAQDRVITLAPSAVTLVQGQVGTAQLPSLSLG